jgi:3-hydroxybutyryl-CoA dehydrogenase
VIVGIVGAGTMGAGIAQVALENGHEVVLHDVDEAAIERGVARVREGLARRAARLDLDADSIDDWVDGRLAGLRRAATIDALGAEAGIAIEAALEDVGLKQEIFRALDAALPADTILATNTSALSVARIAEAAARPDRVLGLHFFNPAPLMPLVEVVVTERTDPRVADRAQALMTAWGKTPVRCADAPGFIVNRVNRPFTLEALAILEAGEAGIEQIDNTIREAGYPMGPFELMDLVGIDVNLAAARGVHDGFLALGDPLADRFRPSPIQERLVAEGRLGRKSGAGFYAYDDGRRGEPAAELGTTSRAGRGLDAAGIVERITLAIILEAYRMGDEGTATDDDIDTALRLGAGHLQGPFERVVGMGGPAALVERVERLRGLGSRFEPPEDLVRLASG